MKKWIAFMLGLACALALVGCAQTGSGDLEPAEKTSFELSFAGNTTLQNSIALTKERPYWYIFIENEGREKLVMEIDGDVYQIEPGASDILYAQEAYKPGTYSFSFATTGGSGMTGRAVCHTYKYKMEITGRMPNAAVDTTFVYLSNLETITFDQAWKAAGLSSHSDDYYSAEEAVLIEIRTH